MKLIHKGSFAFVEVSKAEVIAFKNRWPCSSLPEKTIGFEFDKSNGDLVDVVWANGYDGPDLLALANDAKAFAERETKTPFFN